MVITIITILASLLLPALRNARENGKKIQCAANLKANGQAIIMYASDYDEFIVSVSNSNNDKLFFLLAPYIGNRQTNYGSDNKVAKCPSSNNYVGYGGNYRHILSYGELGTWRKMSKFKFHSKLCSMMDMFDDLNRTYYQVFRCSTCYPSDNYMNFPHSVSANLLFLDGHVAGPKRSPILENKDDMMGHY